MIQQYSKELLLLISCSVLMPHFLLFSVNVHIILLFLQMLLHSSLELLHAAIVFVADEIHAVNNYNYAS